MKGAKECSKGSPSCPPFCLHNHQTTNKKTGGKRRERSEAI